MENLLERYRNFLKDTVRQTIDFRLTDQRRGIAPPPIEGFNLIFPRFDCHEIGKRIRSNTLSPAIISEFVINPVTAFFVWTIL